MIWGVVWMVDWDDIEAEIDEREVALTPVENHDALNTVERNQTAVTVLVGEDEHLATSQVPLGTPIYVTPGAGTKFEIVEGPDADRPEVDDDVLKRAADRLRDLEGYIRDPSVVPDSPIDDSEGFELADQLEDALDDD